MGIKDRATSIWKETKQLNEEKEMRLATSFAIKCSEDFKTRFLGEDETFEIEAINRITAIISCDGLKITVKDEGNRLVYSLDIECEKCEHIITVPFKDLDSLGKVLLEYKHDCGKPKKRGSRKADELIRIIKEIVEED